MNKVGTLHVDFVIRNYLRSLEKLIMRRHIQVKSDECGKELPRKNN